MKNLIILAIITSIAFASLSIGSEMELSKICAIRIGKPKLVIEDESKLIEIYSPDVCWYSCNIYKSITDEKSSFIIVYNHKSYVVTNKISMAIHEELVNKYGGLKNYIEKYIGNDNYTEHKVNDSTTILKISAGCTAKEVIVTTQKDSVKIEGMNQSECPIWLCGTSAVFIYDSLENW
jgi:hypothetical protein